MSKAHLEKTTEQRLPRWKSPGLLTLLGLASAGGAFGTTLPPWITVNVKDALQHATVNVPGSDAAPGVSALALVALVGTLVARLASQKIRYVITAIVALSGVGMMFSIWSTMADPASAARTNVGEATGVVGMDADYTLSAWPWVAMVAALMIIVSAVLIGIASRSWKQRKAKYDRNHGVAVPANSHEDLDEIDTWDSLTRGVDPTDNR
ncbi:Trp biosynthesis-associated membrane protein [Rothia terrae]|uniref:Trp biosynthesis-associated membrane protein n=1 Tax=Rothia terrae TaxID=396015 RepID=A0A7H2BBG5_9MICC|nr:Trp biosynthesis-associated membrane protein [Rothia terrae]QNV37011.1 Trp biosynthesis-associated membrane protein [Rothia terrae]